MTTAQEPLTSASFHPPSSPIDRFPEPAGTPVETKEPTENSNPRAIEPEPLPWRCDFTFADGRQCRLPRYEFHVCFCRFHMQREQELFAVPESPAEIELDALSGDLTTASGINRALGQVFRMLAHKRITQREAAALAYLGQLLLQTVPGARAEFVAAFGYKAWAAQLKSTFHPQRPDSPGPSPSDPQPPPSTAPSPASAEPRSPRDGSPCGESLGSADASRVGVLPAEKVYRADDLSPLNKGQRESKSAPIADDAGVTRAYAPPDYADILSRSLDLFDLKYDTTPEGRREARALLLELELMTPRQPRPPSKRLGVHYEPFPKLKGTRAIMVERIRKLRARAAADAGEPATASD